MVFTEWFLAILYLVGGLNDLFMDLVFYWKPLRKLVAQGRVNPIATPEELEGIPEQRIAIMVPAWDESAVIGAMLDSTCSRLDYRNYDIFVGTYPNDDATQMEVARAAFEYPQVHRVVCPNPGPTSKADCLNWVVEAIKLKEKESGKRYAMFTLQDAEDVVHPLTLKVFNRFVPEYDLIQLPVVPYERYLHKMTGGTYLDEFAEVHMKNLDARQAVGGMVPSAGVGTAFGREACDELAAQTNNVLFPPVSLTEDYDFSFRLFRNGRKSGLAKVWTVNRDNPENEYDELVAIREFFPAKFGDAVRQKQRWMLGIAFQGFQKLGWGRTWRERYMLMRDRIGVVSSLLNGASAVIVALYLETVGWALGHHAAWNADLGKFHVTPALQLLIDINVALLLYRMVQRALCVKEIARRRQMIMVPFRLVWGNVIDFYCTYHAIRRYVHSRWTGKPLKWLKTQHEFPNVESLLRTHRRLGDLLLECRMISPAQLSAALATQKWQVEGHRTLGDILLGMAAITQEQLTATLTLQNRSKVRVQEAAEAALADEPILARVVERADEAGVVPAIAAMADEPAVVAVEPVATAPMQPLQVPEMVPQVVYIKPRAPAMMRLPEVEAAAGLIPASARLSETRPSSPVSAPVSAPVVEAVQTPKVEDVSLAVVQRPSVPVRQAPVIPISRARSVAVRKQTDGSRRFSMLHAVASKWKSPFPSKRILVAIGTRPEAIKLAPLVRELRMRMGTQGGPEQVFVCATGQHQEMVEEALASFGIDVDLNLGVMTPGQTLAGVSARVLSSFETVIAEFQPDWVVVQGDTATTSMVALAAFYAGVRVAHVEAGLRTNDLQHPFPEEFNRRMVGIFASVHFAATDWAKNNLIREGVDHRDIVVTGNTGIDALRSNCERLGLRPERHSERQKPIHTGAIRVLVTAHRRENLEEGIANICGAIANLVTKDPGKYVFLWPLHPNPKVKEIARAHLSEFRDVLLTGPAKYDELLGYLDQCDVVLTDSGGLQEEAPSFAKPVLILREKTERPEGVKAGMAWLVGTDQVRIEAAIETLAQQIAEHRTLRTPYNPYGDGFASLRIADFFGGRPVHEFGEAAERELRKIPLGAREYERLQTVG